jgi:general secretion pathway protein A
LGLSSNPFPVTPDETHYFFTPEIEAIYEEMGHFISLRKGFLLLTGDVGLGKTTLMRRLIASFEKSHFNTALVLTSFLDQSELLETIARDFGLALLPGSRRIDHLAALNEYLLAESAKGKINVLFIDDAQALDTEALDVVRQLSNLETAQSKLIQIVLCGQPELLDTLNQASLRQVKSRIALHRQLKPLNAQQTLAYIHHRLASSGEGASVDITEDGLQMLYECTLGYPRRIHHLMDRCLYALLAGGAGPIDRALVLRAWKDLDWQAPELAQTSPAKSRPEPSAPKRAPQGLARAGWMGLSLAGVTLAAVGGFFVAQNPAAFGLHPPRTPLLVIAEPANWKTARKAFAGLTDLVWPVAPTLAVLTQQFQKVLEPHHWQIVAGAGEWVESCDVRPFVSVQDASAPPLQLSFIESEWPTAPVVLGQRSEPIRQLQQLLSDQGWLSVEKVDGVMGVQTAAALGRFQHAEGIDATGQFNLATAYRLSCLVAVRAPNPSRS